MVVAPAAMAAFAQSLSETQMVVAAPQLPPALVLGAFGSSCTLLHVLHVLLPEERIMACF